MRVVIVFCEGPHDIQFVSRSVLRNASGFSIYEGKTADLPVPFGVKSERGQSLIVQQHRRIEQFESTVDETNFGKKPLYELVLRNKESDFLLFVNMGGDSTSDEVIKLIESALSACSDPIGGEVSRLAFAFFYDADFLKDTKGRVYRVNEFWRCFSNLFQPTRIQPSEGWESCLFLSGSSGLEDSDEPDRKSLANDTGRFPVGLWVHGLEAEGTLEDHLEMVLKSHHELKDEYQEALSFVKSRLSEDHPLIAKTDKRNKAIITIMGQFFNRVKGSKGSLLAGTSFSGIIGKGLPEDCFDSVYSKQIAKALSDDVPW